MLLHARPCISSLAKHYLPRLSVTSRTLTTTPILRKMSQDKAGNKRSDGNEPHQYQAGPTTNREEDKWKERPPYRIHDKADFDAKWKGKCHCGAVQYELSRDKPLASKYCHCTTCQRLHGVRLPFSPYEFQPLT